MQKKLYRSKQRMLFGVCGGIGEYFSMDPTVIRVIWVAIGLLTKIIPLVIIYLFMVFLVPEDPGYIEV